MSMRRHAGVLAVLVLALAAPAAPATAEPGPLDLPGVPLPAETPEVPAAAPVATEAPRISGRASVGRTLEVSDGRWDVADVTFTYRWARDGVAIPGAIYGAYDVRPADTGHRISAVVSASHPERPAGSATAVSRLVARAATSVKVLVPRTRQGRKPRLRIAVTAYKLAPRGAVRVTYGGRVIAKRARLRSGQVAVQLPRRRAGRYQLKVSYLPREGFHRSRGHATVRVRR